MAENKKKVVCVEDEPEIIDLIKLILGRKGFDLTGATGGLEGLEAIRRIKPDLVLLDLMMPDMDGWEVYQQMKADSELKNIPVIVVTSKILSEEEFNRLSPLAHAVVSKATASREMLEEILNRPAARPA